MTNKKKFIWQLIAAILSPFILASCYLFFSRKLLKFTEFTDYAGLAVSIFVGIVIIFSMPISLTKRILLLFIYIPVFVIALFFFSLSFVCSVFSNCL